MNPGRLLILGLLFYLAWRFLRGRGAQKQTGGNGQQQNTTTEIKDILVEDPVCHTLIPKGQAIRMRHQGKTFYFCSEQCCDAFTQESEKEK